MRALSYIIALVLVLTGPSLAGSADRDMPGVGTFTYCGSPVAIAPEMVAVVKPVNLTHRPSDDGLGAENAPSARPLVSVFQASFD